MRLVYVTSRYRPHTGGVETHVAELAERFAARGHDVTVHTADAGTRVDGTALPDRGRRGGVTVRRHRSLGPSDAVHLAPGILPALRAADADVVHAHNYHSLPLALAVAGAGERAFVATPHYHGASADAMRDRLLSLYRPVGRWALGRADQVIAVSEWERGRLAADLGIESEVVPNGLDIARFADATPERRERPYLLTVGRLVEYKGVQHAIRALNRLPEYDLVVAGSGPHREALERVAERTDVRDRVEFRGVVPDADLPGLYAGASAFLALSDFEAYGMTVAEALAAGTPCVVRSGSALAEWASRGECVAIGGAETGELTSEAVASAVERAVRLEAPAEALPGWESVVDRIEAVYADVAPDGAD